MKKNLSFLSLILVILFTSCKSSSVEPAKEYNLKITNLDLLLRRVEITSFDKDKKVLLTKVYSNVNKGDVLSFDFDRCYGVQIYVAGGTTLNIEYTIFKNNQFVETARYKNVDGRNFATVYYYIL